MLSTSAATSAVALEFPLVRTPIELANKSTRSRHRLLDKEVGSILTQLDALAKQQPSSAIIGGSGVGAGGGGGGGGGESNVNGEEAMFAESVQPALQSIATKLNGLKRKMQQSWAEDAKHLERCRIRSEHLSSLDEIPNLTDKTVANERKSLRLHRCLADHLFRAGMSQSAHALVENKGLQDLVDVEIFDASRAVIDALDKHDCGPALAWCNENRLRLKKFESSLEFELRVQEFVELVRVHLYPQAIAYARAHLAPMATTHEKQVQQAMGLLAFARYNPRKHYSTLLDPSRWTTLVEEFKQANFELHYLPKTSMIEIALHAGLCCLKTPQCCEVGSRSMNCPTCSGSGALLAASLPHARRSHSAIVCRISGVVMDDDNPPMVFPQGTVYSRNALLEMARQNNGIVTCPRTGEQCNFAVLRKAFIS